MAALSVCWLLACLLGGAWAQAPSFSAIQSSLHGATNLQGQIVKLPPFDLQMVTNATYAVITFTVPKPISSVGWMAFGVGHAMKGADMNIVWPNSDGSWTVSHRTSSGHVMPTEVPGSLPSDVQVLTALSTSSGNATTVSLLRALAPSYSTTASAGDTLARSSAQPIIYAFSSANPGSSASNAILKQHNSHAYGATTIDLSANNTATASGGIPIAGPATSMSHDTIILAHAIIGSIAWMIISPLAILIATYGRGWRHWFRTHQLLQTVLTTLLTLVAVILACVAVNQHNTKHWSSSHQTIGLIILIVLVVQVVLGAYNHHKYSPDRTKKPWRNIAHIILGIGLTALGFAQVRLGMPLYSTRYGDNTPRGVVVIYGLLVGVISLALLFGIFRAFWSRSKSGGSLRSEQTSRMNGEKKERDTPMMPL
ncbi:MAG: hypothetical protein CYPHOPRED_004159 [Cyphobasidiales sp. Tagirdzhanova-0007]|nr:MAG: hypothetical protein CYPHOPRED_004159 [Cyphobasidiales sp. Tagirdzhanova-0007]